MLQYKGTARLTTISAAFALKREAMATHVIEHVSRTVVDGAAQLAASTPTSNPDRNIRSARALTYFKQVWYLLGCFIALVSLYNISAMLYLRIRKRYFGTSPTRGTASLARIPASLMNAMRAIAFRWTIPLGSSLQLNFAKVFLTLMYCGVLFTWSLMNSKTYSFRRLVPLLTSSLTQAPISPAKSLMCDTGQTELGILLQRRSLLSSLWG